MHWEVFLAVMNRCYLLMVSSTVPVVITAFGHLVKALLASGLDAPAV